MTPEDIVERLEEIVRKVMTADQDTLLMGRLSSNDLGAIREAIERLRSERLRSPSTAEPFSTDVARIIKFFDEREMGTGDDPIGFLLASYAYVIHERNEARAASSPSRAEVIEAVEEMKERCARVADDNASLSAELDAPVCRDCSRHIAERIRSLSSPDGTGTTAIDTDFNPTEDGYPKVTPPSMRTK